VIRSKILSDKLSNLKHTFTNYLEKELKKYDNISKEEINLIFLKSRVKNEINEELKKII